MPPQEGKGLGITAPQNKFYTGSYYQIPLPVLGPNPDSLNHRLSVTIIFQTAPPEPVENQRVSMNFPVQGHPWWLRRAECKVKNNFVIPSIICLPKCKHLRSLQTPSCLQVFAESLETCYRASSKPSLLEIRWWTDGVSKQQIQSQTHLCSWLLPSEAKRKQSRRKASSTLMW